ncbi:hypothetical protein ACTQ4E_11290 [Lawsonibacter sp. LCP25S3_G6]|uniref:hypothetical protein n=1 Tax=unclassified Lawsonibacter TaxID=2617946 RepID=UPI003F9819DD
MKKVLSFALALVLTAGLTVNAYAAEEVIGHALYTDIVTEIDGRPIASYNVGGRTAVMVQDLNWYGLYVYWNEAARAVYVWPESGRPGGVSVETPEYVPQPPEGKVGEAAYPIYASDIKVYVAGEEKESFNIGGHVMVYLSDLLPYGELNWNEEEKLAQFQVAEDPVKLAMDRLEENVYSPEHVALHNGTITYYEGGHGTLAVILEGGTMHGSSCTMLYVDRSGKQTWIDQLLPYYPFGQEFYLEPRNISFDATGEKIIFITPIKELYEDMSENIWGDSLCVFDTGSGRMTTMQPLGEPLESWSVTCDSYDEERVTPGKPLEVVVSREIGSTEAKIQSAQLPWKNLQVTVSSGEVKIVLIGDSFVDDNSPYSQAFRALQAMGLPDVSKEGFVLENSEEQQKQTSPYCMIDTNRGLITGVWWWNHGNGHMDLVCTFDDNVGLREGDEIRLLVGTREEN